MPSVSGAGEFAGEGELSGFSVAVVLSFSSWGGIVTFFSRSNVTLLGSWGNELAVGVDTLYERGTYSVLLIIVAGSHLVLLGSWMITFCPGERLGRLLERWW